MDPLEPFLLPPDVELTAVADLPEHIRAQVSGDGEFAITRPRARTSTQMLSRDAAELLEEFRTAKTVVEAVISLLCDEGLGAREHAGRSVPYFAEPGCGAIPGARGLGELRGHPARFRGGARR